MSTVVSPRPFLLLLLLVLLVAGCGGGGNDGGGDDRQPVVGQGSDDEEAAQGLGFPGFATKNTTRVGGADPIADAAGVAQAIYPSRSRDTRPSVVTLVDSKDWRAAISAAQLMSRPLRAPVLLSDGEDMPEATQSALDELGPTGAQKAGDAQVIRVGKTAKVEDAISAGRFRPLPARTVALAMLGTANWVAWWYRVGIDGDAESVADVLVDLAMTGVRRGDGRTVAPGPWAALELLKEDLTHLQSAMTTALPRPDDSA